MPNANGRQSLVQIELSGKLPHEQPDYLQTVEWDILKAHVNDGMTIGAIAKVYDQTYNKMMMAITRLGAMVARSLELPDSALAKMDITEVRPKSAPKPKAGRVATVGHSERPARAVMSVTVIRKTESLDGCDLDLEGPGEDFLTFKGLPRAAAADFEVGKTYNLYLG